MICSLEDFNVRPYKIYFQEEENQGGALLDFIGNKEEEILRDLLGTNVYNAFIEGLEQPSVQQRWVDLRDGAVYEYSSVQYEYKGLVNLLVPCIFAYWVKETSDTYTNSSTVRNTLANAQAMPPGRRIGEAYGRFLELVGDECNYRNTLYGFMLANLSDYDDPSGYDWIFCKPGSMNQFDL